MGSTDISYVSARLADGSEVFVSLLSKAKQAKKHGNPIPGEWFKTKKPLRLFDAVLVSGSNVIPFRDGFGNTINNPRYP